MDHSVRSSGSLTVGLMVVVVAGKVGRKCRCRG